MFRYTMPADIERPATVIDPELIPLSVLALDIEQPSAGWTAYLAGRDIAITTDDIGRPAIARVDARQLLTERAEHEARRAEFIARADEAAIQFDREWRAQLGVGVPASAIPAGMSATEAMFANELASHAYQPRRTSMAEDLFDNSGGLTFHPISQQPDGDES
jgi:hypothetical protein